MHAELQLDNQICFRLYTAARLITQAYTPMLTELGITYPQYLVLMVLWEKDCQPVNDIAHRLLLETNTVTPLLQRMEKLGIVIRKKGEKRTVLQRENGDAAPSAYRRCNSCLPASTPSFPARSRVHPPARCEAFAAGLRSKHLR